MAGQVPTEGMGTPSISPGACSADLPHHDHATPDPGPFTADFKKHILSTLQEWHLPGLAIGVIDGANTYLEGFGHSHLSPPTPVTPTTLFMAGSTTKAFTATVLGLLLTSPPPTSPPVPLQGWKTPISTLLPTSFVTSSPWATAHLTLDDAVSHRTGLPRHDHASARSYSGRAATPDDILGVLRHFAFTEEPRTTFQYNNLMYVVLSQCAEAIAGDGRGLGEMMRGMIWEKLGMGGTFYGVEDLCERGGGRGLATGYAWEGDGFREVGVDKTPELAGAGLVISCVEDYGKWVRCLLEGGGPVMGREVAEGLRVPRMVEGGGQRAFDSLMGYACGWSVGSYKGHKVVTHSGMMEAYGANIIFFPDDGYGVVALGNTAIEANAVSDVLLWRLIDDKFGVPQEKRFDWAKKWRDIQTAMAGKLDNPIDIIFPHRTPNPLPPSLPLEQYVGRYFHPGYQNMVVELGAEPGTLKADRRDFTWQLTAEFKHVSGEFWVMCARSAKAPKAVIFVDIAAVEFRVGVDGKVKSMGVEWRDTWGPGIEELVWYDRVD